MENADGWQVLGGGRGIGSPRGGVLVVGGPFVVGEAGDLEFDCRHHDLDDSVDDRDGQRNGTAERLPFVRAGPRRDASATFPNREQPIDRGWVDGSWRWRGCGPV